MNRRGAGVVFCMTAVLLFAARYIAAAILGGGRPDLFRAMLDRVGPELLVLSILSLVIGVVYLIKAEVGKQ